jgi:anti-anti-sigma factor
VNIQTTGGTVPGVPFFVTVTRHRDHARLRLAGELDMCGVHSLSHAVDRIIAAAPAVGAVTADLGGLSFVDVAGGRALLQACQRLRDADLTVTVTGEQDRVRWVLGLLGAGPGTGAGPQPAARRGSL